jgi:hypothetical protein
VASAARGCEGLRGVVRDMYPKSSRMSHFMNMCGVLCKLWQGRSGMFPAAGRGPRGPSARNFHYEAIRKAI